MPEPVRDRATDLEAEVEAFDRFTGGLVRLEPHPLAEVRTRVERFAAVVAHHLAVGSLTSPRAGPGGEGPAVPAARLRAEHERFRSSIDQLRELLGVVERDDHGGHRQALGQYGRIFVEALRSHLGEESASTPGRRRAAPARVPDNGK